MTESIHAKSLFLNAYKMSCLVKHIVKASNIHIGDYTILIMTMMKIQRSLKDAIFYLITPSFRNNSLSVSFVH